ncbi:MAG: hypothetical protein ACYTXA_08115 [Nostoc sp.]
MSNLTLPILNFGFWTSTSLRDPSLRDATRSLQLLRSTASSGHRATRTLSPSLRDATRSLLPRSGTTKLRNQEPSNDFGLKKFFDICPPASILD